MRKSAITTFCAVLVAGLPAQMTAAAARHVHRTSIAADRQPLEANKVIGGRADTFCSQQPGNPHDERTDYQGWSAWRQLGAWDSRYDC